MTYQYLVVNDRPDGAWSLDSYPFVDVSGNGRRATGKRVANYALNPNMQLPRTSGDIEYASSHAGTITDEYEDVYVGPRAIRTTVTGSGGQAWSTYFTTNIDPNTTGTRTYTVGFWIKGNTPGTVSVRRRLGGTSAGIQGPSISLTENWQWIQSTHTFAHNGNVVKFGPSVTLSAPGSYTIVSGLIVVEGDVTNLESYSATELQDIGTLQPASYGQAYYISKTPTPATPLVSTTGPAVQVTPEAPLELDSDVMGKKFYTLEAWFKPLSTPAPITILGRTANSEGLVYDGEAFRFRTNFATAPYAEAVYYPSDQERAHHVVGVSTALTNQLWVDGVLESEVVLTEEQKDDGPASTSNALVSGYSTDNAASAIVDFPAVYDRSLNGAEIVEHFQAGRLTDDFISTILFHNGNYWTLDDSTTVFNRVDHFDSAETWAMGYQGGVSSINGTLEPDYDFSGTTVEGEWRFGFSTLNMPTIAKSKIEWDSDGPVTVEFSTDDVTWTLCVSGRTLPGLTDAAESIAIRVTFPSGISEDTALVVRSLTLTLYQDITMVSSRGNRSIQWFGEVAPGSEKFLPIEQADLGRLEAFPGYGVITPSNLPDSQPNLGTLELWVKPTALGATQRTLVDFTWNGSAGARVWWTGTNWQFENCTVYVNGQVVASGFTNIGLTSWSHVVVIPNTPTTDAVRILSDSSNAFPLPARLGLVVAYQNALDPTTIGDIYNSYLSISTIYISDSSVISVQEPVNAAKVYSLDWTVQTA